LGIQDRVGGGRSNPSPKSENQRTQWYEFQLESEDLNSGISAVCKQEKMDVLTQEEEV
jgi:hypothetical protein